MTLGNAAGVLLGVVLLAAGASKLFDKGWAERERGLTIVGTAVRRAC
jgi:Mn2+/Fe2+ NRAMP family transporter